MFESIRTKIMFIVGGILSFVIFLLIIFNLFFAKKFYLQKKSNEIQLTYDEITENYSDNIIGFQEDISNYEDLYNLRITIFNEEMKPIYNSREKTLAGYKFDQGDFSFRFDKDVFSKDKEITLIKRGKSSIRNLSLYTRYEYNDKTYYIAIETPVSAIEQNIDLMNEFILYTALVTLLIGMIIVFLFTKKITNPIIEIDNVAQKVCEMDFSVQANEDLSNDEIGHLAKSINIMSEKISSMISELKDANEELEFDNRLKEKIDIMRKEFIANVSHELKTPLSLLMGYTEILKKNIKGIDKEFYYDVILDETEKMSKLVNDLLRVSRIESGLDKINLTKINFSELVSWICTKNDILFSRKFIKKTISIEKDLFAFVDKAKIEQAIKNYIINAISHTKENGEVIIKVNRDKNFIKFSIFNEGDQINKEDIPKIWDSFYKNDKSRTRSENNNVGLGLYIVKTIIDRHGGEYGVVNHANGVEFWFRLKRVER